MKISFFGLFLMLAIFASAVFAQNQVGPPPPTVNDTVAAMTTELAKITKAVKSIDDRFKAYFDKMAAGSTTVTDKQQKMITGIQLLATAEQRVISLQTAQFDYTTRYNDVSSRLIQIDSDLRPRNIDRSVAMEGTTETEELREARRQRLQGVKATLSQLQAQLRATLQETAETLRDAQSQATRLRRIYMPLIDREMSDQQ